MPQKILGIDLGSWSVKGVLLESSFRGYEVRAAREVRFTPREDDASPLSAQLDAVRMLLEDGALRADGYVVGFPGEQATTRFVTLPFHDQKRVDQTIGGELEDAVPFELDEAVYDHAILKKLEDGGSLSLAAVAPRESVRKYLSGLQEAGVDPKFLPIDALQLYNLYAAFLREDGSKAEAPAQAAADAGTFVAAVPGGPPDGRLTVDIGHERTLLLAASEHGIAYLRVIRAGGRDVTEAISEAYGISYADAEEGKHSDALVTSSRHPTSTDEAQRMAEVCAGGLDILVKELRRALQAIRSEKRVRIARIDLLGGGSRIKNLANYLAEQLNVPVANGVAVEQVVETQVEAPRRPAYALALAVALRTSGETAVSGIDLRVGELQYAGQLQHLKQRIPTLAAAAALLLVLFGVNVWARYHVMNKREAAVAQQFCDITEKVLGKQECEPVKAISLMRTPATELGTFALPERSAFRVAADVSQLMPAGVDIWVNELDVTSERARVSGETASFEAVDQLVSEYAKDTCLTDIKKSKLRKKSDNKGVEFQLSMKLGCS